MNLSQQPKLLSVICHFYRHILRVLIFGFVFGRDAQFGRLYIVVRNRIVGCNRIVWASPLVYFHLTKWQTFSCEVHNLPEGWTIG